MRGKKVNCAECQRSSETEKFQIWRKKNFVIQQTCSICNIKYNKIHKLLEQNQ